MLKKVLIVIFIIVCGLYVWFKTPVSSDFYLHKGITELKSKNYTQAVSAFEHSLAANPANFKAEYYLVQTLSELKPTYSVQKKTV